MADAVSSASFREALARFASGVVVVTGHAPEGPVGFTVSAFSSVSLEPPLVLFCVGKTASAYDGILAAPQFGISVLEAGQAEIAAQFARHGVDRFAGVALRAGAGVPLIEGAVAQLECRRHALHDAGDHTIVVGEVLRSHSAPGEPLVHHARRFGDFVARP
jgi:flavin reductase (DIM6/NTAB) family NADH-FMN oxidoreductase RutF